MKILGKVDSQGEHGVDLFPSKLRSFFVCICGGTPKHALDF